MNTRQGAFYCAKCGADNILPAKVCWLCKQGLELPQVPQLPSEPERQSKNASLSFSIASVLLVTTLSAVFFSVLKMAPGLAILLAILSLPALVRTGLAAHRRSQLGKPISPMRKLLWFLGSLTVTTILVVVVLVASLGTFCAVCLSANSPDALPVAFILAGAVAISILIAGSYWIRYRWRRDIDG